MKKTSADLTQGKLNKQILFFSLPLILSNLLQVLFNLSDIAVVGHFAGAKALGAVGSTTSLVCLFTGLLIGMGSGVNALTALYIGAKSPSDTRKTVHTSAILCLLAGLLIMMFGFAFSGPMLNLLNTKEELFADAKLYLIIYFAGLPANAVFNFGNGVYSAAGNTRKPLLYLSSAGILNVVLNLIFTIFLSMGVAGVGLATAIAQFFSATLVIISLFREKESYGLKPDAFCLDKEKAHRMLAIGVPAGLQNAIFQVANSFILAGVNSFDAVVVEGNSAATNADSIVYNTMQAFYVACSSFISQNYGARNKDRMIKSYYISTVYSFVAGGTLGLLLVAFGRSFLHIFTADETVIDYGMIRLTIMGLSYAFSAFMDNTIAAARGLGKTGIPTIIVIMGSCVFRVIWVYTIFAYFHTMSSLYLLYIFSWSLTAIAEIIYFAHIWKQVKAEL